MIKSILTQNLDSVTEMSNQISSRIEILYRKKTQQRIKILKKIQPLDEKEQVLARELEILYPLIDLLEKCNQKQITLATLEQDYRQMLDDRYEDYSINMQTRLRARDTIFIKDEEHQLTKEKIIQILNEFNAQMQEEKKLHLEVNFKELNTIDYLEIIKEKLSTFCKEFEDIIDEKTRLADPIAGENKHDRLMQNLIDEKKAFSSGSLISLCGASLLGRENVVEILLKNQKDIVNKQDQHGELPLHTAAAAGQFEIAKLLLQNDANPMMFDDRGYTAIHYAAFYDHVNILELFYSSATNKSDIIEAKDKYYKRTPLDSAAFNDSVNATIWLAEHHAKIDVVEDNTANTPLHTAAQNGSINSAAVLLKHGANVHSTNRRGETPLHSAIVGSLLHPNIDRKCFEGMCTLLFRYTIGINTLNLISKDIKSTPNEDERVRAFTCLNEGIKSSLDDLRNLCLTDNKVKLVGAFFAGQAGFANQQEDKGYQP